MGKERLERRYEMTVEEAIKNAKQEYVITTLAHTDFMNLRKEVVKILIEQAEQLETQAIKNNKAISNINALEVKFDEIIEQNKRYREAIEDAVQLNLTRYENFNSDIDRILQEALESEEK